MNRNGYKCTLCGKSYRTGGPNFHLHTLPRKDSLRRIWEEACGVTETTNDCRTQIRICNDHFEEKWKGKRRLTKNAIPTLNLVKVASENMKNDLKKVPRETRKQRPKLYVLEEDYTIETLLDSNNIGQNSDAALSDEDENGRNSSVANSVNNAQMKKHTFVDDDDFEAMIISPGGENSVIGDPLNTSEYSTERVKRKYIKSNPDFRNKCRDDDAANPRVVNSNENNTLNKGHAFVGANDFAAMQVSPDLENSVIGDPLKTIEEPIQRVKRKYTKSDPDFCNKCQKILRKDEKKYDLLYAALQKQKELLAECRKKKEYYKKKFYVTNDRKNKYLANYRTLKKRTASDMVEASNISNDAKMFCKMLLNTKNSWKDNEKMLAKSIWLCSTKGYTFMRKKLFFNLPSRLSLMRFIPYSTFPADMDMSELNDTDEHESPEEVYIEQQDL